MSCGTVSISCRLVVVSPMIGAWTSGGGPPNDAMNGLTVFVSSGRRVTSMTSSTTMEPPKVPLTTTRPTLSTAIRAR